MRLTARPIVLGLSLTLAACGVSAPAPSHAPKSSGARFIVGGDSRDDAAHVLPWAFQEAKQRGAMAFVFLGDMELTPSLDDHFRRELPLLDPIPFYPVLGNHEVNLFGAVPLAKQEAERAFRRRFLDNSRTPVGSSLPGKVVYAVDLPGGVHFVALDNVSQRGFGADQLTWLASDLQRAHSDPSVKYIMVGMHKPLANNGVSTHGMDQDGPEALAESKTALDLFVTNRVAAIFASHVHEFAEFTQGGIKSYISGGLGAPLDASGASHAFHHLLQVDVTDDAVHVEVVRFDGAPSIEKEPEVE